MAFIWMFHCLFFGFLVGLGERGIGVVYLFVSVLFLLLPYAWLATPVFITPIHNKTRPVRCVVVKRIPDTIMHD